ncbi:MAG: hypothetical protein ACFBZ8_09275 [Opitutales bacterium]
MSTPEPEPDKQAPPVDPQVQKRADRHLKILYVVMAVFAILPFILLIFFKKD